MDASRNISPPSQGLSQHSIRSFFQPRSPSYTAPPAPPLPTPRTPTTTPLPSRPVNAYVQPPSQTPPRRPNANVTIPPPAGICRIQEQHIQPIRRINSLLLPIAYPDSFYHKITAPASTPSFSRVITWTDPAKPAEPKVIGAIVCRLDPTPAPEFSPTNPKFVPGSYDLYIQSLALLSPYRGKGLAAAVLDDVIASVASMNMESHGLRVAELYAHVWTENTEALEWYSKNGFRRDEGLLHGYYRKLKPDSAWILRRRLLPSDHIQPQTPLQSSTNGTSSPRVTPGLSSPLLSEGEKKNSLSRPSLPDSARSFQDRGPDREWNDLPEEVLGASLLKPPSQLGSAAGSSASSRSSSRSGAAGKKKRVYPAAAFGS